MTLPHMVSRFACLFLFGPFIVACLLQQPAEAANGLTFAPANVRFGEVVVGKSETLPAVVTNSGTTNFTLSTITGATGEFRVQYAALPLTLAPGQSTTLNITFLPTVAASAHGTIAFNGSAAYLSVYGSGMSNNALLPNPPAVSFGNVAAGGLSKTYVTLTNSRSGSITIANETTKGTGFAVLGLSTPLTLTPGQSFTFTAEFLPQAVGLFSGSIQGFNARGEAIVSVPVTGTGTAAGQLSLSPASISFGSVNVGSNLSKSSTLTASGGSVTLTSASSSNSEFSISGISFPKTIAAGQSVSYSVTFTPQMSGSASSTISFASNASNSASESLSGTGLAATHTVSLVWNPSTSSVSGYNVYRGTVSGGPYSKMNGALDSGTTYIDNSVSASKTYYYVTTAVNSSGQESGYSNQVQVVIP